MTTVKLLSGKSSKRTLHYLGTPKRGLKEHDNELRYLAYDSLGMGSNAAIENGFEGIRRIHNKLGGVESHHASINFNPADSVASRQTDEELIAYGNHFIAQHAPGHEYAIYIHRDNQHLHMHIIWNSVNTESGRKFNSTRSKLYSARSLAQEIDRDRGFNPTLGPENKGFTHPAQKLSSAEIQMKSRNSDVYLWKEDLKNRISSCASTSQKFDEFRLNLLGLGVVVTERGAESLTYSFVDSESKQRKSRASSLGDDYGKRRIAEQLGTSKTQDGYEQSFGRNAEGGSKDASPRESFSALGERTKNEKDGEDVRRSIRDPKEDDGHVSERIESDSRSRSETYSNYRISDDLINKLNELAKRRMEDNKNRTKETRRLGDEDSISVFSHGDVFRDVHVGNGHSAFVQNPNTMESLTMIKENNDGSDSAIRKTSGSDIKDVRGTGKEGLDRVRDLFTQHMVENERAIGTATRGAFERFGDVAGQAIEGTRTILLRLSIGLRRKVEGLYQRYVQAPPAQHLDRSISEHKKEKELGL
ncbi:MAG: hypothetical protein EOP06_05030 [Proteobacteria bacterium]|nr:MAG: hypothetical protein EOP06_05030 [Pseudomonadota bacterium]